MALAHVTPPTDPDSFVESVARNIRTLLAMRGLKAQDLADAIGMKETKLSQRMGGHSRWLADELLRIAKAFAVDTDVIFAADEQEFREALARSRCSSGNSRSVSVIAPTGAMSADHDPTVEVPGQRQMALAGT